MISKKPRPGRPRLTHPLIREGSTLRQASWDEALHRIATALKDNRALHGDKAFGIFSCSKSTNEMNFVAQKFCRQVMGSNNIDSCNRT
jgi:predicted molibdopterin-dependent oxidoreductase YjgC